jgi:hypothetical protein
MVEIKKHYSVIDSNANTCLSFFGKNLTGLIEGHFETDIAGSALITNKIIIHNIQTLFKSITQNRNIIDLVKQQQKELLSFIINCFFSMGIDHKGNWNNPIPEKNLPLLSNEILTIKLLPQYLAVCNTSKLHSEYFPYISALSMVKIISIGIRENRIDLNTTKSIIYRYFINF